MWEENVEIVRRIYAEWERGNFWTGEYFHPEVHVRWVDPIVAPAGAETRGLEELGRGMREMLRTWEHMAATAERIIDVRDEVVSVELWRGRGKASGAEIESRTSSLWRFAERKVTYLVNYGTPEGALEAAGLAE